MNYNYPPCEEEDHGCKVSWRTYDSRKDAEKAAEIAKTEAKEMAAEGYDFGYLSPGDIETMPNGQFKVVCP